MQDEKKSVQMTFDFADFSDAAERPSPADRPGAEFRDDMTPGLFDPVVSEEEEMEDFFRKIHPAEPASEETDPAPVEAEEYRVHPSWNPVPEQTETQTRTEGSAASQKIEPKPLTRKQLKRAALAFLASLHPAGLALDVVVRDRNKAGAAAFWMESGRITRTAAAEIRTASDARIETACHSEQFGMLRFARMEREMLEQEIRRTEPGLRDESMLFSEFEHWNYAASRNPAYQDCQQKIRHLEHAVFHGSRLERFRSGKTASLLYLVVPEHTLEPDALSDGWGLVQIKSDLSFEVLKEPERQEVPEENLVRLALSVAAAGSSDILFSHGIHMNAAGTAQCGPLPRRRRRKN